MGLNHIIVSHIDMRSNLGRSALTLGLGTMNRRQAKCLFALIDNGAETYESLRKGTSGFAQSFNPRFRGVGSKKPGLSVRKTLGYFLKRT